MGSSPEALLTRLEALGINAVTHRHPPLFTVEQAKALRGDLPGCHCKCLFLKEKKGGLWLVVTLEDRRVDLKALSRAVGARGRFSFASAERLEANLGVAPGAVTPFALVNDHEQAVHVVLDAEMMECALVNYHPLTNEATTALTPAELARFIADCGHRPVLFDFSAAEATGPG